MTSKALLDEILKLPPAERLRLIEDAWDSLVASPEAVRAQAVATANAPDQNVVGGSRVNSRVISTMNKPAEPRVQAQKEGAATAK